MAKFEAALAKTLEHEGGYSNDPNDSGLETFCGISRKWHPNWSGWVVIDGAKELGTDLSKYAEEGSVFREVHVKPFYRTQFWTPLHGDEIASQEIANYLFDFAVNSGIGDAVKALQKANNHWFADAPIEVDGIIGHDTITALFVYTDSPHAFLESFKVNRLVHILENIGNGKIHTSFAKGLSRRARV